ncbi:MAG: hypothetical protein ACREQR_18820 [Candidatus Binataceae bacterium]
MLINNLKLIRSRCAILAICLCGGLGAATLVPPCASAGQPLDFAPQLVASRLNLRLAQAASASDDREVPPDQVEKYIAVYRATQSNHSLTVEQAATQQGLTVAQFRTLEGRIEHNDALRARVRKALRNTPGTATP